GRRVSERAVAGTVVRPFKSFPSASPSRGRGEGFLRWRGGFFRSRFDSVRGRLLQLRRRRYSPGGGGCVSSATVGSFLSGGGGLLSSVVAVLFPEGGGYVL
ncbi:unnamed protein product, partial [Brassica rapa]